MTTRAGSAAGDERETPPMEAVPLDLSDPHASFGIYADLRARGPVVRVCPARATGGASKEQEPQFRDIFLGRDNFFVTRYEQATAALLDDRFSVNIEGTMTPEQRAKLPPVPEEFRPLARSLLSVDAPDHTRLRKLVQPSFTARAMEALRPRIQQLADELLDKAEREAAERGEVRPERRMDLIEAFAYPLPVKVISDMLGIPQEDREQVRGWTQNLLQTDRNRGQVMSEESRGKLKEFIAYLRDLFKVKRRRPAEDLISQLVQAEEDGDRLDEDELLSMVFIIYLAGHVTTVNLIGNGVVALLTHPEQLAKFKADPGLAKGVVEETLRYWGPVDFIGRRIARQDLELGGAQVGKGELAMVGLASANRDPGRFANPDVFDITRPDADRHIAFGKGIHVCLGAPLARVEGQIAFETLLRRFPELRLAVPAEELHWGNSLLRGFDKVPVLY